MVNDDFDYKFSEKSAIIQRAASLNI